jgi:hypothetical protein
LYALVCCALLAWRDEWGWRVQIKRNTRLRDEEWSDVEEDAREAKVAKTGLNSSFLSISSNTARFGFTVYALICGDAWDLYKDFVSQLSMCAEQIEPEDMVLKARVENLRKQVKEAAARVHAHRTRVPAEMRQQAHKSIEQARSALESSLASSTSEQHALPATLLTVSEPVAQGT